MISNNKIKHTKLLYIYAIFFLVVVILTGERSNSIKALLGILIFFFFFSEINLKKKIFFTAALFIFITSIVFSSDFLKLRFFDQIKSNLNHNNIYFKLYRSGYEVFKDNMFFGVGNKNYRVVTCKDNSDKKNSLYICQTHPHQIYFDLLSEHGIFGVLIILFIFYKLIFSKIKKIILNRNFFQIGSLIYLTLAFLPLLAIGAFFSDFSLTLFSINLSIMYSSSSNMNIFSGKIIRDNFIKKGR